MSIPRINADLSSYPKKNVLTSLLWLSGITFPSSTFAFCFAPWPQGLIAFVVGSMPVVATVIYYRHWANKDVERLQTEDYRIQKEFVARIVDNRTNEHVTISSTPVQNPNS